MVFLPFDVRTIINPQDQPSFEVDVTPTQDHDLNNEMTQFPLEDGTRATDHITVLQNAVELDLTWTDTPISKFNPTTQFQSKEGRSRDFFRKLQDIKNNRIKCSLITGLQSYKDMYIEKISIPRRAGDGKKVSCLTTFRQLIINSRAGSGRQGLVSPVTADVEHTVRGLIELGDVG